MLNKRQSIKRARKRRKVRRLCLTAAAVLLLAAGSFYAADRGKAFENTERPMVSNRKSEENIVNSSEPETLTGIYSKNGILIEPGTGKVLAAAGAEEQIYPASMTKIMTALLVVEEMPDLEQNVVVPEDIFQSLYTDNASRAGFEPGEEARAKDLLYGILLPSGAECCLAMAEKIDGSEEAFAQRMNQRARELGMKNTNFTNCTGLHNSSHYTTVKDMALLLREALKNAQFREAFTASRYSTQPTRQHSQGFTFESTMFRGMDTKEVNGGEILGGKTGYTQEAGLCLASLARINGKEYILVTAGARGDHKTKQYHILDAKKIYGDKNLLSY